MGRPLKYKLDVYDGLGNPLRRRMLEYLKKGETPASQLHKHFRCKQACMSRHLQVLRRAGLVRQRQDGNKRLYRLNLAAVREMQRWVKSLAQ